MKILVASANRAVSGGAETYLRAILPRLAAAGHELSLMFEVDAPPGAERVDDSGAGLGCAVGAEAALRAGSAFQPDVVYYHGWSDPRFEAELVRRHPAVLYAHAYYGTCASGTKLLAAPHPTPCSHTLGAACL